MVGRDRRCEGEAVAPTALTRRRSSFGCPQSRSNATRPFGGIRSKQCAKGRSGSPPPRVSASERFASRRKLMTLGLVVRVMQPCVGGRSIPSSTWRSRTPRWGLRTRDGPWGNLPASTAYTWDQIRLIASNVTFWRPSTASKGKTLLTGCIGSTRSSTGSRCRSTLGRWPTISSFQIRLLWA